MKKFARAFVSTLNVVAVAVIGGALSQFSLIPPEIYPLMCGAFFILVMTVFLTNYALEEIEEMETINFFELSKPNEILKPDTDYQPENDLTDTPQKNVESQTFTDDNSDTMSE